MSDLASLAPPAVGATLLGPGKRLVFTRVAPEAVTFEEMVAPDAPPVPLHLHLHQSERFTVLDGTLDLTLKGRRRRLGAGETILVPPCTLHTYTNGNDREPLRIEVTLDPGLDAHRFFECVYGLGREGYLPPRGLRDALSLGALAHRHGFYLAGLPLAVQRPLMGLAAAARAAGIAPWTPAHHRSNLVPTP